MGGTGVIDHFLEVFTRYIDSGFGLLSGEVIHPLIRRSNPAVDAMTVAVARSNRDLRR